MIETTFVLSIGTSEVERGFSKMTRLKDNYRNSILEEGLQCDMFLSVNGPDDIKDLDADKMSLSYYHAGHARADDPLEKLTQGTGLKAQAKRKEKSELTQGTSIIFKKQE